MIHLSLTPNTINVTKAPQERIQYLQSISRYPDDPHHEELKPQEPKG